MYLPGISNRIRNPSRIKWRSITDMIILHVFSSAPLHFILKHHICMMTVHYACSKLKDLTGTMAC